MTPADRIAFVFSKSLAGKPDGKFVGVKAADLLVAFGEEVCRREFGLAVQRVQDSVDAAKAGRLAELDHAVGELAEMVAAGFRTASKELRAAQEEQQAIRTGRLLPKPIVSVEVGKLRALVLKAREARQTDRASPSQVEVRVASRSKEPAIGPPVITE